MPNVDYSLIYQAQKFITAENVHNVNTWIFCYENSQPPCQMRYEQLLREFVAAKNLMIGARIQANVARFRGIEARLASTALDEEIKHCCDF